MRPGPCGSCDSTWYERLIEFQAFRPPYHAIGGSRRRRATAGRYFYLRPEASAMAFGSNGTYSNHAKAFKKRSLPPSAKKISRSSGIDAAIAASESRTEPIEQLKPRPRISREVYVGPLSKTHAQEVHTVKNHKNVQTSGIQSKVHIKNVSCVNVGINMNFWYFPKRVNKNNKGAFLIPYLIMMVVEGAPLFLLELGIGQRLRQGSLGVWTQISPWWAGLGIASTIVSYLVGLYYNVIIAWCFYYLFNSFKNPLPFGVCPNETIEEDLGNNTFKRTEQVVEECALSSETAYFWYRQTLDASGSISDPEGIKWWMALCLVLSWILVWLCIMKGIQSSGKVVYFTALFPYMILIIFFGRAVTLKGAGAGLKHMFTPKMEKLLDPTVWMDAACQVFYSLGLAFGSLIAFASYNPIKNNCKRDALFMCTITVFTATFATIDIFAVLG
ncbi:unnamed protein product, partial [Meganyctiphanes norvegica]